MDKENQKRLISIVLSTIGLLLTGVNTVGLILLGLNLIITVIAIYYRNNKKIILIYNAISCIDIVTTIAIALITPSVILMIILSINLRLFTSKREVN